MKTLGLFKNRKKALKDASSRRKIEKKDRKDRPRRFGYRTYKVQKTKGKSWKVISTFNRYKTK